MESGVKQMLRYEELCEQINKRIEVIANRVIPILITGPSEARPSDKPEETELLSKLARINEKLEDLAERIKL